MESVTEGKMYNFHHKGTDFFALKCISMNDQEIEFEKGDGSRITIPKSEIVEPVPTVIH